ncbi:MAG: NAD(P)/FAD-dependent oxidoreductase [Planctomycetota bacterium]
MDALVFGGGPAGLMAAERLLTAGARVQLCEAGERCARKLQVAARGSLNLTTADPHLAASYGAAAGRFATWLARFGPRALCAWADGLGVTPWRGNGHKLLLDETAGIALCVRWLERLEAAGLELRSGHRFVGWDAAGRVRCSTPAGIRTLEPRVCVLACGGGSWPGTGSDGAWVAALRAAGLPVRDLRPANCGIDLALDPQLLARHAGTPLRNTALHLTDHRSRGNLICTRHGLEGTAVYRLIPALRAALDTQTVALHLDCQPDLDVAAVARRLARPRASRSLATHLKRCLRLDAPVSALLRECASAPVPADPARLAALLKRLPLPVTGLRPLTEAISSAGGLALEAVDDDLRLRARPQVFCAGEMLDWEAPTGGYLLQGCFTTGWIAGEAAAQG